MDHITQWHEYSDEEKVAWLLTNVLDDIAYKGAPVEYDLNLVGRCEAALSAMQRGLYVKYMDSAIAAATYKGKTEEECSSREVVTQFYWNYATAPVDLRARIIWNIVAEYAP